MILEGIFGSSLMMAVHGSGVPMDYIVFADESYISKSSWQILRPFIARQVEKRTIC